LVLLLLFALIAAAILSSLFRRSDSRQNTVATAGKPQATRIVSPQAAAKRAICLASLVLRAQAEYDLHPEPGDSPHGDRTGDPGFVERVKTWMKGEEFWEAASPRERSLLEKPLGSWSKQEIADGQWREDALVVLLWALQPDMKMPTYDEQASQSEVMKSVPHPAASQAFVANAKFRDPGEITNARDTAELWLWRARTTQLQREHYKLPKGTDLERIVAETAKKAQEERLFKAIDNDFPALGKPYAKLSAEEWQTMRSIATERLYAFNWICGYAEDWDEVPAET